MSIKSKNISRENIKLYYYYEYTSSMGITDSFCLYNLSTYIYYKIFQVYELSQLYSTTKIIFSNLNELNDKDSNNLSIISLIILFLIIYLESLELV